MPNRFARRIRSGEIGGVDQLKSEFKALAKATHPDLAGPGSGGGEFAALRSEYEDALRDFVRLRYGGPAAGAGAVLGHDRRALYADLSRLVARGFPKVPRHEKEKQRYEGSRYLVRARLRAWDESYPGFLDGFEAAMLDLVAVGERASFDEALALLASILEYHAAGVPQARAAIELDFARFRFDRASPEPGDARGETRPSGTAADGDALCDFLGLLVGDMALGPASAHSSRKERT